VDQFYAATWSLFTLRLTDFNDAMLMGTLSGIEMALSKSKVPHAKGGADAAMAVLAS
jgi:hypothetical protein